jgi:hypothetical protein
MDMGDTMMMGGTPTDSPLNASGIDFSNDTQASIFLGEILDDGVFQVDGNMYATTFWFGICAVIAICAFLNVTQKITFKMRYARAADFQRNPLLPVIEFELLPQTGYGLPRPPTCSRKQLLALQPSAAKQPTYNIHQRAASP